MVLEQPWAQKEMSWAFEKTIFLCFCKYLSDEVEGIFCESETKYSKLFKSKFGHRKLLRKWFWSYLELKNECSERLKRAFQLFASFLVTKLKPFSGKGRQFVQIYLNQNFGIRTFLENGFGATLSSKTNVEAFEKNIFQFFANI